MSTTLKRQVLEIARELDKNLKSSAVSISPHVYFIDKAVMEAEYDITGKAWTTLVKLLKAHGLTWKSKGLGGYSNLGDTHIAYTYKSSNLVDTLHKELQSVVTSFTKKTPKKETIQIIDTKINSIESSGKYNKKAIDFIKQHKNIPSIFLDYPAHRGISKYAENYAKCVYKHDAKYYLCQAINKIIKPTNSTV